MLIEKGFILFPRAFYYSELAEKPPHFREIWFWLLKEANHSDQQLNGKFIRRGQLHTSYDNIIDGLKWYVGRKKYTYKKHEVERAFKHFTAAARVTTLKATRGMIVTICNYDYYQTANNYTGHTKGHNKNSNVATIWPQDKQELKNERKEEKKSVFQNNTNTQSFCFLKVEECFKKLESELGKNAKPGAAEKFCINQDKLEWKYNGKKITNLSPHIKDWILKDATKLETVEREKSEVKNSKSKLAV